MCDCRCRVCKGCHTRDCRYLTPGTESGGGGNTRDCGSMIPGAGSRREVMLETVDM